MVSSRALLDAGHLYSLDRCVTSRHTLCPDIWGIHHARKDVTEGPLAETSALDVAPARVGREVEEGGRASVFKPLSSPKVERP